MHLLISSTTANKLTQNNTQIQIAYLQSKVHNDFFFQYDKPRLPVREWASPGRPRCQTSRHPRQSRTSTCSGPVDKHVIHKYVVLRRPGCLE